MNTILLSGFTLIKPEPGLILWTTVIFLILWLLLGKFAFRPIANALKKREQSIDDALKAAEKARLEMQELHSKNEQLLKEALEERSKILKEAKEMKESILVEARNKAKAEYEKIAAASRAEMQNQMNEAKMQLKNFAADLAISIAEKVVKRELQGDKEQQEYVKTLLADLDANKN